LVKLPKFGNQANGFLEILEKSPITYRGFDAVAMPASGLISVKDKRFS
jgi:hypothetical protein